MSAYWNNYYQSIMTITKKLAGVVLGLVLLAGAAAPASAATATDAQIALLMKQVAALQAQLAALLGDNGAFNMNLTVGSSGTDVTRLQNWLISKGYAIPAGATGYFGAQTQSALARYQAATGIVPASGYFGPLTRARVNGSTVVVPTPTTPTPDTSDRTEAADAIDDLDAAIDDAQDDIDDAEDDGEDVDEANDLLDDARDLMADAEDAYDDGDYDEVMDLVNDAEEKIDDALDEANVDTNNNSGDADENDAEDAIDDLDAAIDDAQAEIDDAEDDGEDVDDANDLLDDARDLLADAEDALDDEDYDEVMDLTDEGQDLVDDALDEANVDNNDDDDATAIERKASTMTVGGSDNDYASFEITLRLKAFGDDMYISQDADDAFTYQIEDASNGSVVASATTLSASLSSTADDAGDYYVIQENDSEEFTFTVNFNPLPGDEGKSYRLQLLTVEYNDTEDPADETWSTNGDSKYQTPATYVGD